MNINTETSYNIIFLRKKYGATKPPVSGHPGKRPMWGKVKEIKTYNAYKLDIKKTRRCILVVILDVNITKHSGAVVKIIYFFIQPYSSRMEKNASLLFYSNFLKISRGYEASQKNVKTTKANSFHGQVWWMVNLPRKIGLQNPWWLWLTLARMGVLRNNQA